MPTFQGVALKDYWKRLLQISQTGNSAPDTTIRNVEGGDGTATALYLSDDGLVVNPQNDDGGAFAVKHTSGATRFNVNTSTAKVTAGANATNVLTQYARFSVDHASSVTWAANNHYVVPFEMAHSGTFAYSMGSSTSSSFNDTNPPTSKAFADNWEAYVQGYWYLQDDITIDKCEVFVAPDDSTTDNVAFHLMKYDLTKDNGSDSGDLSNGVVMFDGAVFTANGDRISYQDMDDQVTTASAGQVLIFTAAANGTDADYSIRSFIKYHIT